MTAHAMEADRARCLEAGMDDYLAKPIRIADVRSALLTWLVARRETGRDDGPELAAVDGENAS
jgi:CheY-like chemotaxis protein